MVSNQCELPTLQEFDCRSRYRESRDSQCLESRGFCRRGCGGCGGCGGGLLFDKTPPPQKNMDTGYPLNAWKR